MADEEDRLEQLDSDIQELIRSHYLAVDEDGRFQISLAGRLALDTRRSA